MKLEIKHIAPYLPYGLKCKVVNDGKEQIGTLTGLYSDGSCVFADLVESEQGFDSVEPLLNPLSELGENEIKDIALKEGIHIENVIKYIRMNIVNYRTIQMLLKHYYDVFGLIDNGLAEVKGE